MDNPNASFKVPLAPIESTPALSKSSEGHNPERPLVDLSDEDTVDEGSSTPAPQLTSWNEMPPKLELMVPLPPSSVGQKRPYRASSVGDSQT